MKKIYNALHLPLGLHYTKDNLSSTFLYQIKSFIYVYAQLPNSMWNRIIQLLDCANKQC